MSAAVLAVVLDALTDHTGSLTANDALARRDPRMDGPGLYCWWVDESGTEDLVQGLGFRIDEGLIYAGQAGSPRRARNGAASRRTLRDRIVGNHLEGNVRASTFRRSLGAILTAACVHNARVDGDELTGWMRDHLVVTMVRIDDRTMIGDLEFSVLQALDPPLNLQHVPKTPLRRKLSALRVSYMAPQPDTIGTSAGGGHLL